MLEVVSSALWLSLQELRRSGWPGLLAIRLPQAQEAAGLKASHG